jgi:hypothetical protein
MLDYLKIEKIFIYCRVSTLKQADNIDEQYKLCFDWIKNNFNENILIDYYYDIKSTYNNENALTSQNSMLKKLNKNNLIVIKDISRLGRNEFQCINVLKKVKNKNAYIFSVEENLCYNDEFISNNYFLKKIADSKLFSDNLSLVTKLRNSGIKKVGGHIGKTSYGYKLEKKNKIPFLQINDCERKIIKLIKFYVEHEKYDYELIANILNEKKILNRNKYWNKNTVKYIYKKNINNNYYFTEDMLKTSVINYKIVNDEMINNEINNLELRTRTICKIL